MFFLRWLKGLFDQLLFTLHLRDSFVRGTLRNEWYIRKNK